MSERLGAMSAPGQTNFRGFIPELDGLRAVGLCFVLLNHFWPESASIYVFQIGNLGWIAMDSFFVMSGFLITGILLDSRDKPNYYRTYYARRSLRIFPLYYLVLLIWVWIARYTDYGSVYRDQMQHWGSPIWFFVYLGNVRESVVDAWPRIMGFGPLWSLQVEEQFYLLFPLAVAFLRKEHLRRLMIAAVVVSPLLRCAAYLWRPENSFLQYVLLPCHCEGLALGALVAIRFRSGPWKISKLWLTVCTALLLAGTCAGSLLSTWGTRNPAHCSQWDRLAGYSISSIACACLVLWLVCFRGSKYTAWMRIAPLQYLGRISYGVYLLHPLGLWIVMEASKKHLAHYRVQDPLFYWEAVALSLLLAAISWHFFERPLLKIKDRIQYAKAAPVRVEVVS